MRFVLTPVGSSGDVFPFLGIGACLRDRGHDVTVVTAEPFRTAATRAGLQFEPHQTTEAFERTVAHPDLWHPTRGLPVILHAMADGIRPAYDALERVYRPGTVLVGHSLSWVTRAYEELHDVPAVTVHLAPGAFRSLLEMPGVIPGLRLEWVPRWGRRAFWWTLDRLLVDRHIARPFNAWRAERGLPPVTRFFRDWLHSPQRTLGVFPPWFHAPPPDWPPQVRLTTFPLYDDATVGLDPGVQAFLDAGPPPILFAAGSANRQAATFYRAAVDATSRLGTRAILQTAFPEQLPTPLPPHVHHAAFVPFSAILPRCAAAVHHGGIGTSAQGLAAGIPQLTVPLGFDQFDNTDHLLRLGVADWLLPARLHAARLARVLGRLLESTAVHDRCRHWRDRLAAVDPLEETCDLIEEAGRR